MKQISSKTAEEIYNIMREYGAGYEDYILSGWDDYWDLVIRDLDGWELQYSEIESEPYEVSFIKNFKDNGTMNRIKIRTYKNLRPALKHIIKQLNNLRGA